jgi:integrase
VRKRLAKDLKAATAILNSLRARADRADFGLLDNDYALADLRREYEKFCRQTLKPTAASRYLIALANIVPQIGASKVSQVTMQNVVAYREDRLKAGKSPRTVNIDVGALRTMLRWAMRHKLIGSNPLAEMKPLRHDRPKEGRALSDDEVTRLLDKSPRPWRDIWYAYLVTGIRKMELASLTFADIDRDNRELVIRGAVAKNHRERRIPIDGGLWEIIGRQEAGRQGRQPGRGKTPGLTEQIQARLTRDHVFVSTQNTPLTHRSGLYNAFMRCCKLAGIATRTFDRDGRLVEHVDLHSLRRTFATSLIEGGADPKSVQELLGHRTLDMTMRIYAKVRGQTKRQALGRLTYGQGTLAPAHVLEYPGNAVQFGHKMVTSGEVAAAAAT